jgi:glycosyltransferase involved in cell wall biosynthesis
MKPTTQPLVSIIVPTRNSATFLRDCLESISNQTYRHIELIVVDRDSTDTTKQIAREFTPHVYNHGPERSAQVNFGVEQAKGEYVYKVDADFILDPHVVEQCVAKAAEGYPAVVVHNSPDATISWIARVRRFEVDMYKYDLQHSSARFVRRDAYRAIGGFNTAITAGEDYDFQNKLNRAGYRTGFIEAEALHRGEPTSFWRYLVKCYGYGKDAAHYQHDYPSEFGGQTKYLFIVWFRHWRRFIRHPLKTLGLLIHFALKFTFAAAGLLRGRIELKRLLANQH